MDGGFQSIVRFSDIILPLLSVQMNSRKLRRRASGKGKSHQTHSIEAAHKWASQPASPTAFSLAAVLPTFKSAPTDTPSFKVWSKSTTLAKKQGALPTAISFSVVSGTNQVSWENNKCRFPLFLSYYAASTHKRAVACWTPIQVLALNLPLIEKCCRALLHGAACSSVLQMVGLV